MKYAVTFFLFSILAFKASALDKFSGVLELNNKKYDFEFTYSMAKNQSALEKQIRFFDEMINPETYETIPAFCQFELKFPFEYSVQITDSANKKLVYTKTGIELIQAYTGGGFVNEGKCQWDFANWNRDLASTRLRVSDLNILISGQAYRFTLDTLLLISTRGVLPNEVVAMKYLPQKNMDGVGDGEVWLDTMPDLTGEYQRTYFRLNK